MLDFPPEGGQGDRLMQYTTFLFWERSGQEAVAQSAELRDKLPALLFHLFFLKVTNINTGLSNTVSLFASSSSSLFFSGYFGTLFLKSPLSYYQFYNPTKIRYQCFKVTIIKIGLPILSDSETSFSNCFAFSEYLAALLIDSSLKCFWKANIEIGI